jgi:putative nucleotidyltransferase with HDIG domain
MALTVNALNLKDRETESHSRRVTAYAIAIAKAVGLSKERISVIARGAFVHDIGKIAIPDAILRKPGPLDSSEIVVVREHASRGYHIVSKIPFLAGESAEIVYSHHERYDGTGYPRGLKGEEIPLGARIVAIVNALDSMTSDLPYRAARSFRDAKEEIQVWSGRQFDPELVNVFLSLPDGLWEDLRREAGRNH